MCESTMKYFSPSFSYKALRLLQVPDPLCVRCRDRFTAARAPGGNREARAGVSGSVRRGAEVEADVLGGVLRVGEHDRPVVLVDHPAVVGGHVLLELGGVEEALLLAQRLGDLVVDEVHPAGRVDPDHRREVPHGHVRLLRHDLGDDRADLVVHQRHAALVGGGVVRLVRRFCGLEPGRGHWASSFGTSRCRLVTMPENRLLAASRLSSKRGGLASVCDHSGCSLRPASMAIGTYLASQPSMIALLWSANSLSVVSRPNIAVV